MDFQLRAPLDASLTTIQQIFKNRDFPVEEIEHYVNLSAADVLPGFNIDNMPAGAKMLMRHLAAGDKVFVQVDSDCDGYTSAAALLNYLNHFFPHHVQANFSYRLHNDKRHGIIFDTVPEDVKLVIAPDSSSSDYEVHQKLVERGCDVLVIDHHEAEYISPHACVINNQLCDYPNKTLSGVGMVYKFCQYLDTIFPECWADHILDLTALGLVGDMMDIRAFETRYLIEEGIKDIVNPFFKAMVEKQAYSLQGGITPFKLSFYVVPYINAITRVGTMEEKILLFESMLEYRAYEKIPSGKRGCKGELALRVDEAIRVCNNVKSHQQKDRDKAAANIEQLITDNNLLEHKILIIRIPNEDFVNSNLRGLVANELCSKYQHPTLILAKRTEEDGVEVWSGSGRGLSNCEIDSFREYLLGTGLVRWATGHGNAFGVAIECDKMEEFIEYTNKDLEKYSFSASYKVDFILDAQLDAVGKVVSSIADFAEFWGQGLEEPKIAIKNVRADKSSLQYLTGGKRPTLKITKGELNYMKFGVPEEEYKMIEGQTLNIVGTCELNTWNGRTNPQVMITDYEIVEDLMKPKMAYYF